MQSKKLKNIQLRELQESDFASIQKVDKECYTGSGLGVWSELAIKQLISDFPEGQFCVEVNGEPVAFALSLVVDHEQFKQQHVYNDVINNGKFDSHNPHGDMLYGIEVMVSPRFRGHRLGNRLYEARKTLCERLNLKGILLGGRIPNYKDHARELTPMQYLDKVHMKEIHNPVLNFQLSNGFSPITVLEKYIPDDEESLGYAILLQWTNPRFQREDLETINNRSRIRLGVVQWNVRPSRDEHEIKEQINFFVDSVSSYRADFILFPEFFNAALMTKHNHLSPSKALRALADYTPSFLKYFSKQAVTYNVNIITGSMPLIEKRSLYNVAYLCRRDGSIESYRKIHITPAERKFYGMVGHNQIKVFDTDAGKIAILICYDIEFPELARILALQGVQIIFVPFQTDTRNGYLRVRKCAEARAVENECYVAIAGCIGNIPKVKNMDINYAESAVFSPSDFNFPQEGVITCASPNTECMLIADVNLDLLKELHHNGSVNNLKDRRSDLYSITWKPSN